MGIRLPRCRYWVPRIDADDGVLDGGGGSRKGEEGQQHARRDSAAGGANAVCRFPGLHVAMLGVVNVSERKQAGWNLEELLTAGIDATADGPAQPPNDITRLAAISKPILLRMTRIQVH